MGNFPANYVSWLSIGAGMLILRWLSRMNNWQLGERFTRRLLRFFAILSLFVLMLIILAFFHLYLRALLTDRIVSLIFLFTGSFLYLFGNRAALRTGWKIVTGGLFYVLPVCTGLAIIPSYLTLISLALWANLGGSASSTYYEDQECRIEKYHIYGDLSGNTSWPVCYRKQFIFEKKVAELSPRNEFNDSIQVLKSDKWILVCMGMRHDVPDTFAFKRLP